MTNALTLSDGRGARYPNPRSFNLKWPEEQKLLDELDKLMEQLNIAGRQEQALEEDIRKLEHDHAEARALAFRGGATPDGDAIAEAREKLEERKQEIAALRRAVFLVREDLIRIVQTNKDERRAEVEEAISRDREEVEILRLELHQRQRELDAKHALKEWLSKPELPIALPLGMS